MRSGKSPFKGRQFTAGECPDFVLGGAGDCQAFIAFANRSPKMTAICALAAVRSRGGIFNLSRRQRGA